MKSYLSKRFQVVNSQPDKLFVYHQANCENDNHEKYEDVYIAGHPGQIWTKEQSYHQYNVFDAVDALWSVYWKIVKGKENVQVEAKGKCNDL